ncbi:hypothetical protein [Pseudonocardia charpentierae]|uniref:Uncharacterized protein n=1 Tax=Pseudonocardia charpentierae TaxID=3075545 RepID=A0ABU2NJ08_9PSEU|nr:hypothetical protein [Pseudonocardia sp. DSM 45834]MDT0353962.1 hypothetical protein [Pseudonocardia sp. DSM 45834]
MACPWPTTAPSAVSGPWQVTRRGDGAVCWACPQHLAAVCDEMQRDDEVTELVVVLIAKLVEWLQLGAHLEDITRKHAGDS